MRWVESVDSVAPDTYNWRKYRDIIKKTLCLIKFRLNIMSMFPYRSSVFGPGYTPCGVLGDDVQLARQAHSLPHGLERRRGRIQRDIWERVGFVVNGYNDIPTLPF